MAGGMLVGEGHVWWGPHMAGRTCLAGGCAWQEGMHGGRMHAGRREWQERQRDGKSSSLIAVLMLTIILTLGTTYLSKFNTWRCVSSVYIDLMLQQSSFPVIH